MARLFENVKFHHCVDSEPKLQVLASILPLRHCCKQTNIEKISFIASLLAFKTNFSFKETNIQKLSNLLAFLSKVLHLYLNHSTQRACSTQVVLQNVMLIIENDINGSLP